jgi:hypothetical protein
VPKPKFKEVLDAIWKLQQQRPFEPIEFSGVATALQLESGIVMSKDDLVKLCHAMAMITPHVEVLETAVALRTRPDLVIESFRTAIADFPEPERKVSVYGL